MEKLTFKVPEGTESIEQSLENGMLITKFIPKVEELKDLDCYRIKNTPNDGLLIFKDEINVYLNIYSDGTILENDSSECGWGLNRHDTKITREEMQAELAKHGKYFDFEEKVLKSLRWRAEKGVIYYHSDTTYDTKTKRESGHRFDNELFEIGNYHQTKEQAEEYAQKMIDYSKSLIK
jgi:hypothetical protein